MISAFQNMDGNGGTYGKPLEILATINLFFSKIYLSE